MLGSPPTGRVQPCARFVIRWLTTAFVRAYALVAALAGGSRPFFARPRSPSLALAIWSGSLTDHGA